MADSKQEIQDVVRQAQGEEVRMGLTGHADRRLRGVVRKDDAQVVRARQIQGQGAGVAAAAHRQFSKTLTTVREQRHRGICGELHVPVTVRGARGRGD